MRVLIALFGISLAPCSYFTIQKCESYYFLEGLSELHDLDITKNLLIAFCTLVGHLDHNLSTRKTSETPLDDDEELGNSSTSLEANANQGRKHNNPFVR